VGTPPQLVIFDCDGVLVDSERIAVRIEVGILAGLGMDAFGYAGSVTPAAMLAGERTTVFDDMRQLPALLADR
jgi:phosphoglycolate phosphatase-like HAD superfamily hydrolase